MTEVTQGDRAALERLLGVPEMAWLVARVRPRIATAGEPLAGVVQLTNPSEAQRIAAARLVGRPRRVGATLRLELADVEAVLRRGLWPAGLADAVQTLTGPVVDRAAAREREAGEWAEAATGLRDLAPRLDGLGDWWDRWCRAGGLKRAARSEAARSGVAPGPRVAAVLVQQAAAVLASLPSSGEPLPVLARRITGDAHALDSSRPLGRLTVAAVQAVFAPDATSIRDAWSAGGVESSSVASTVLCLGVPGASQSALSSATATATATALEAMQAARMPLVLTLDQVRSGGVAGPPRDGVVHVCENPTIVEVVADRWAGAEDTRAAPLLVCTWGQPSTAVMDLMSILAADGAEVRYHGDFDWPGVRIAETIRQRVTWTPWRYTAVDYLAVASGDLPSRRLSGNAAPTPWDPALAEAMAQHGLAVEEEAVAELLAEDVVAGW